MTDPETLRIMVRILGFLLIISGMCHLITAFIMWEVSNKARMWKERSEQLQQELLITSKECDRYYELAEELYTSMREIGNANNIKPESRMR